MRIKIPPRAALRTSLAPRCLIHREHRRLAGHARGRASALERVMRRTSVHTHRWFGADLQLMVLVPGSAIRHTERIDVRQRRSPEAPVFAIRRHAHAPITRNPQHRRTLVRRSFERLTDRWIRTEATSAVTRVLAITRVEQRQAAPRLEMLMVRVQAPAATAAGGATMAGAAIAAPGHLRPGAPQPRQAASAPPLVLPAQELSRVTDHVIRQLDHRVLSWQERTGRV